MHLADTDRIYDGLLKELDWADKKLDDKDAWGYLIEETTVGELAGFLKQRLGMKVIQIVGNPEAPCSRIGILVGGGSLGLGREQMPMEPDAGEGSGCDGLRRHYRVDLMCLRQ